MFVGQPSQVSNYYLICPNWSRFLIDHRHNIAWGGAMAVSREVFERTTITWRGITYEMIAPGETRIHGPLTTKPMPDASMPVQPSTVPKGHSI